MAREFAYLQAGDFEPETLDEDEEHATPFTYASAQQATTPAKTIVIVKPPQHQWVIDKEKELLEPSFLSLSNQIESKYSHLGKLSDTLFSEEYAAIIGMGPRVVGLLLKDLEVRMRPWFWALQAITREDPAADVRIGDFRTRRERWLEWGRRKGMIS